MSAYFSIEELCHSRYAGRVSTHSVRRWIAKGIGHPPVKLRAKRFGRRYFVTEADVDEFEAAILDPDRFRQYKRSEREKTPRRGYSGPGHDDGEIRAVPRLRGAENSPGRTPDCHVQIHPPEVCSTALAASGCKVRLCHVLGCPLWLCRFGKRPATVLQKTPEWLDPAQVALEAAKQGLRKRGEAEWTNPLTGARESPADAPDAALIAGSRDDGGAAASGPSLLRSESNELCEKTE